MNKGVTHIVPLVVIVLLIIIVVVLLLLQTMTSNTVTSNSVVNDESVIANKRAENVISQRKDNQAVVNGDEYVKYIEEGRKALIDRRYDEAQSALLAAKAINDTAEVKGLIKTLDDKIVAFGQEEKDGLDKLFEEADKLKSENKWDDSIKVYELIMKDYPTHSEDIKKKLAEVRHLKEEAMTALILKIREAKKQIDNGNFLQAVEDLKLADRFYPYSGQTDIYMNDIRTKYINADMIKIPTSEAIGGDSSGHIRSIKLPTFYIDKYEVTNEKYAVFVMDTGYNPPAYWKDGKIPVSKEKCPVVCVTFDDAKAFAKWAGKRLPTEDEWEKAARYIDGRKYPWGDVFPDDVSKIPCNSLEYNRKDILSVGSLPAGNSPYGVVDMAGNVWEWVDGTVMVIVDGRETNYRILKGGSFMTSKDGITASSRLLEEPSVVMPDTGFRCAKD